MTSISNAKITIFLLDMYLNRYFETEDSLVPLKSIVYPFLKLEYASLG